MLSLTLPTSSLKRASALAAALLVVSAAGAQSAGVDAPSRAKPEDEPRLIRGNDLTIAPPPAAKPLTGPAASLRFENAPLADVVHVVLREIVKADLVVHPPINGAVTLSTQSNVSPDQALLLLEAALQANGYQMVVDNRGTYHVGKPESLRAISPAVRQVTSAALPPGHGAVIFPLKYIGAGEMAAILRPLVAEGAIARVDTVRNLLVMVGSRSQAEGWVDLVKTFDVDLLKGMSVGVFPLKHVTTREVEAALRLLTAATGGAAAPGGTAAAAQRAAGAGTAPNPANPAGAAARVGAATAAGASAVTGEAVLPTSFPLYGALRVLPLERLNSLIVITPRAAYLDEARAWIEKLDQPGNAGSEPQLFVYRVQNGAARHLADVLNGLFGGTASGGSVANSGVAPGLQQGTVQGVRVNTGTGAGGGVGAGIASNAGQSTVQGTGVTSVALPNGLRIIGDELNNSVLVFGSPREYQQIEATLKRLDVPPTQVLIEASIIEVTLTDDLKYGVQWFFSEQQGSGIGTGILSTASGANAASGPVFGAVSDGFSYTLRNSLGNVRAVLNALATKSLVKVISSPSLMVLDNHTASIAVGNQQPIRSSETVTTGGNVTTAIQYKDTGVSLSVTPSVNAGNMVTMQLNQAVTDVGTVDTATGQRSFLQRQIGSKVAVRAGDTLVLGGLIRDNSNNGNSGLPGLKDIPLLGGLFGQQSSGGSRTELLVVITPQVIRSDDDLRDVSSDLRSRMKTLIPIAGTP